MRKIYFTMMAVLALAITAFATDYVVSGHWRQEMNGLYVETGTSGGSTYFVKAATNGGREYAIAKQGSCWGLGEHRGNGMVMGMDRSCDQGNPPLTGWGGGITIAANGPGLKYLGTSVFTENKLNDGAVSGNVTITHNKFNGETFSGVKGDDFISKGFINLNNLPAGLTVAITKAADDTLQLTLSGKATSHSADQTFTISFADAAFSNGGTVAGTGNTSKTFTLNFINEFHVASAGADFTSVTQAAAAADNGDLIFISGETYTEADINVSKALTFIGQGADKTIIQAAATASLATNRVFNVSVYNQSVEFRDLTIQNGRSYAGNGYGGGINGGYLKLFNCRVINNIALSQTNSATSGGGIGCQSIEMNNCEVSGNSCNNENNAGQILGGGVATSTAVIVNSTFSGNYSGSAGGGLFCDYATIINSTFTNNNAKIDGGGIYVQYPGIAKNSIFYGNTDKDVYVLQQTFGATNCIVGTSAGNGTITGSPSSSDPLLAALANNGGTTQTHALQAGSPAIDNGATGADIPNTDQRGLGENGTRDIGAFEYNGIAPLVTGIVSLPEMMMTVYPNPNNGIFKISVSNSQVVKYSVFNLDGKLVQQKQVTDASFEVDLSNESQGIYFLKLENNHLVKTVKVVKL